MAVNKFFTKKQKALMRKRRKKVKHSEPSACDDAKSSSSGEKRRLDEAEPQTPHGTIEIAGLDGSDKLTVQTRKAGNGSIQIRVPSNLSSKDVKSFRKKVRRQIKQSSQSSADNDADHVAASDAANEGNGMEVDFVDEKTFDKPQSQPQQPQPQQPQHKTKKHRRNQDGSKKYPSIKELLQQKKDQETLEKARRQQQAATEKRERRVPDDVKLLYRALDCEMVGIGIDGKKSALARVSIVEWDGTVTLDTFVQVPTRVTDFRTYVSGITPAKIRDAMPEAKCRDLVANILRGKVLVGHALSNDLKALMLHHPKNMIRDTAKYRPFQRYANHKWRPRKLRDIVKENLSGMEGFQEGSHDSVDDARATMEVFKLVQDQWEKSLETKR